MRQIYGIKYNLSPSRSLLNCSEMTQARVGPTSASSSGSSSKHPTYISMFSAILYGHTEYIATIIYMNYRMSLVVSQAVCSKHLLIHEMDRALLSYFSALPCLVVSHLRSTSSLMWLLG